MMIGLLGAQELALIVVAALVIFGGGKLAGVGKSLGKSVREFKEEVSKDDAPDHNEASESKED